MSARVVLLSLTAVAGGVALAAGPAGAPRFTEHLLHTGYGYAFGLAAADLDGDGKLDLTSADATRGDLAWFANLGQGKFARHPIKFAEAGWFERHSIGDVDGDGKPDVVVVKNQSEELIWFRNPGGPAGQKAWDQHVIATKLHLAYDVCLADFNGDGKLDAAASTWVGQSFVWFENPGKVGVAWPMHVLDEKVGETRTIRVADFNGDGRPDLLGTARTGNLVAWYENPGPPFTKKWLRHDIDTATQLPTHGHPVDLDRDGDADVVMACGFAEEGKGEICWYENVGKPGTGVKWAKHVIGALPTAFEAAAGDLTGDGKLDVAATAWGPNGKVVWFEHPADAAGKWTMHVLKEKWVRANSVLVADLDGDGRGDVVAAAENGTNEVRWWRNAGAAKP